MRDGERAAEVAAELVALEDLAGDGEVVASVQLIVADELEDAAVEAVGAALGGGVEEGSAAVELCGVGALLDGELLQGVDGGLDEGSALVLLADVHAIEQEGGGRAADAGDGVAVDDLRTDGEGVAGRSEEGGAGGQLRELEEAPAVEGELRELTVRDHLADGGGVSIEQGRGGIDLDGGRGGADLELEVFAGDLADLDLDGGGDGGFKAGGGGAEGVDAGFHGRNDELAATVGGGGLGDVGAGVGEADGGTRDDGAGGIGDAADKAALLHLGRGAGRGGEDGEREQTGCEDGLRRSEVHGYPLRRLGAGETHPAEAAQR